MRTDPQARSFLAAEARRQLPAERDLERGRYSARHFVRYDLTAGLLDYLADAFDVLEVIAVNRRRLRVDEAITVSAFDIIAKVDESNPELVVPVALSVWPTDQEFPG